MHTKSKGVIAVLWVAMAAAAFGIGRWIAPPPHEAPVPDDLAASLRSALGAGGAIERQEQTARLLKHLDPAAVPAVAALYERMIPLIDAPELGAFFAAWARFDPVGALDYALAWPMGEMRQQQEIGVGAAIQAWAHRDPTAARLATAQLSADHGRLRTALRRALVTGWAASPRGQEGLAGFLAELQPLRPRVELIETAARELVRGGGAEAALGWAEPILRDAAYDAVLKRSVFKAAAGAAAQWDPERTAAWAMEHSGADYAEEGLAIVARHWGRQDGVAAMAWLGEQPAGELRDQAVREAYGQWSRTAPREAGAWLDSEELTTFHDPAFEYKALRRAAYQPDRALGWCESITDAARRQGCIESVAKTWYGKDAVAAETWLQQSALDEETRRRVREVAAPQREQKKSRRPRAGGVPR
jgi:hypothetical protein